MVYKEVIYKDIRNYTKLSELVTYYRGNTIAECFKNKMVKFYSIGKSTILFHTIEGNLIEVSIKNIKSKYLQSFLENKNYNL